MAVALVMCLTADNVSSFSFLVSGSQSHITTRNQKLETCLPAGRTRNAFFRSQALSLSAANIPSASVIAKQAEIEAFLETIRKSQAQARHDRHALEMLTLHIIRKLDAWNDILPDATRDTLVQILVD